MKSNRRNSPRAFAKSAELTILSRLVGTLRTLNAEMPMQQAAVLVAVAQHQGLTASELVALTGTSQASFSRSLDALSHFHRKGKAGLGLVERYPDPRDNRRMCLALTHQGAALVAYLEELLRTGPKAPTWAGPIHGASPRLRGVALPRH
jgi:DNA-binding MarR family transcriptional regulator